MPDNLDSNASTATSAEENPLAAQVKNMRDELDRFADGFQQEIAEIIDVVTELTGARVTHSVTVPSAIKRDDSPTVCQPESEAPVSTTPELGDSQVDRESDGRLSALKARLSQQLAATEEFVLPSREEHDVQTTCAEEFPS